MNGYNKIDYAVNIVEAYRHAKGLSGEEVAKLFGDAGVFKFLEDFIFNHLQKFIFCYIIKYCF